jgi:two-component system sensor histidine kinase CpxA
MKSIYSRILLWSFGTLVFSLVAFLYISVTVATGPLNKGGPMQQLHRVLIEDAQQSWRTGGRDGLQRWMDRLRRVSNTEYYVTDASGTDLLTGQDRSALLQETRENRWRGPWWGRGRPVIGVTSADGEWRMVVLPQAPVSFSSLAPYYLLVLLAVAVLCWLLAVYLVTPLRKLARSVDRFGRGELDVRSGLSRKDEIGDLARVFDNMAGRLQTLLTAERRLLQDIAHELRSPLARLSFAAELLDSREERPDASAQIKRDITRLSSLVGSLVEMTRAEGDPSTRRRDPIDLCNLVEDVAADCLVEAEAKHCGIQVTCGAQHLLVEGDGELLRRAVENVLRNAIRYTAEQTVVEVGVQQLEGVVEVRVRDHGPGVPEAYLDSIFAPFFRADASRDAATGGVGLGLAIARRAITLHHGEVRAANRTPGLEVRLRIPAVATTPPVEPVPQQAKR